MVKEKVTKKDMMDMFDCLEKRIEERERKIAAYIEDFKKYHRIFFYGAGADAKFIASLLRDMLKDREVCFIDSNKQKHGLEVVPGIFCHDINAMYGYGEKAIIIISSSRYADEIEYELMGEKYQIQGKLLGTPICADFSLLIARNKELEEQLTQKDKVLLYFELLDNDKDRRKAYYDLKSLWRGRSFREYDPDEFIPPEAQLFSDHLGEFLSKHLSEKKGNFVLCSAFSKDKIAHIEKAGYGRYNKLYTFELNRIYISHEIKGMVGLDTEVINACLGDKDSCLTKEVWGSEMKFYDWLNSCSDEFAEIKSLDAMIERGEITGRISLVRLCIGNGTGPALRGMKKILQRDRPLLILQSASHWKMPEDNFHSIVAYLHELVPEYKIFTKCHLPEGMDGGRNLYLYV